MSKRFKVGDIIGNIDREENTLVTIYEVWDGMTEYEFQVLICRAEDRLDLKARRKMNDKILSVEELLHTLGEVYPRDPGLPLRAKIAIENSHEALRAGRDKAIETANYNLCCTAKAIEERDRYRELLKRRPPLETEIEDWVPSGDGDEYYTSTSLENFAAYDTWFREVATALEKKTKIKNET